MIVMQNTDSLGIFKWRLNALTFAKLSPAFTFILRVLIQRHTYNYSSINVHNCTKSSGTFRNQLLYGSHYQLMISTTPCPRKGTYLLTFLLTYLLVFLLTYFLTYLLT